MSDITPTVGPGQVLAQPQPPLLIFSCQFEEGPILPHFRFSPTGRPQAWGCQTRRELIVPTSWTGSMQGAAEFLFYWILGLPSEEGTNCSHLADRLNVGHVRQCFSTSLGATKRGGNKLFPLGVWGKAEFFVSLNSGAPKRGGN